MWPLERPNHSARATYQTCISRVRDAHLAQRLTNATDSIAVASAEFEDAARHGTVHQIATQTIVPPDITAEEMERVYTQRMAKAGSPGRDIYDELFASSPQGRCPLCMQRPVGTLDHFLPKARYPALAVNPSNLVPACSDCNKAKLVSIPSSPEDVALHPYYDDLGDDIWLHAEVVESRPAAVSFRVAPSDAWTPVLTARVRHHFKSLGLASLFASEAAEELVNIRHQLTILKTADPQAGVKEELARRADSCSVGRPNGWRAATYRAWEASEWFCQLGFSFV